eukprot:gnl/TRDRNA2_/TRDRNA2_153091_c0_seq2.p1 gnl/TRDRNA2_/TRDRNA2_153091_c0~~gnl/TRDRNA2_/TRDRNA2_153091_c0_seq2.p1  ORF type:complete len:555 (-),score=140.96 gnl/TRDRNA2_/TRDRNA2_153091_c0_seq2:20-1579(-)
MSESVHLNCSDAELASTTGGPTPRVSTARRAKAAWSQESTLPDRSNFSAERYKEECLRLKAELGDRRDETRQLQQRVRLLEGTLSVRMSQLEVLVEELRSCNNALASDKRLADKLDRIVVETRKAQVVLHVHAEKDQHLEAKDKLLEKAQLERERFDEKQDMLKERLAETQQRLAAKVRDGEQRKPKVEQTKRTARKQEELVAAAERKNYQLHERLQAVSLQLEDERRMRQEQESTAQRLASQLSEARFELSRAVLVPTPAATGEAARPCTAPSGGRKEAQTTPPPIPTPATALGEDSMTCWSGRSSERGVEGSGGGRSAVHALRQEHEALRREVKAHRKRMQNAVSASPESVGDSVLSSRESPDTGTGPREDPVLLREALKAAEQRCIHLEQASEQLAIDTQVRLQVAEQRIASSEALAGEAVLAHHEVQRQAKLREAQSWAIAEVANEVAMQADLRQVQVLQEVLASQRAASAARVANEAIEITGTVTSSQEAAALEAATAACELAAGRAAGLDKPI